MTIKQLGGVFGRNPTFNDVTVDGDAVFPDGSKAIFGAGSDLQIYHDGANSYIDDQGTGRIIIKGNDDVRIRSGSDEEMIVAASNGATTLYYDSFPKIATASTGVSITGNVIVNSGNGIDFSATSGTGTSELFDDYEEGTWTPTLYGSGGGSATVTVNNASYTKIGNTVRLNAYIFADLSAHTIVGDVRLGGLPYNGVSLSSVASATYCNMFTFDEKTTGVSGYMGGNHFQLMQGSSVSAITATELGSGASAILVLSATYPVS